MQHSRPPVSCLHTTVSNQGAVVCNQLLYRCLLKIPGYPGDSGNSNRREGRKVFFRIQSQDGKDSTTSRWRHTCAMRSLQTGCDQGSRGEKRPCPKTGIIQAESSPEYHLWLYYLPEPCPEVCEPRRCALCRISVAALLPMTRILRGGRW